MKLLIQRVQYASVDCNGARISEIGPGLLILVGCRTGDTTADADYLARRLSALRIFCDDQDRMNRSVQDIQGSVLLVSQFTLYADTRSGNRPGFSLSGDPSTAKALYEHLIAATQAILGPSHVQTGVFGGDMKVALLNDGPVTIELSSDSKFPKP